MPLYLEKPKILEVAEMEAEKPKILEAVSLDRRVIIIIGEPNELEKVLKTVATSGIPYYRFSLSCDIPEPLARFRFYSSVVNSNNRTVALDAVTCLYAPLSKRLAEMIAEDKSKQYIVATYDENVLTTLIEKTKATDLAIYVVRGTIKRVDPNALLTIIDEGDVFFNLDKLSTSEEEYVR
jgi:hypothetical protein